MKQKFLCLLLCCLFLALYLPAPSAWADNTSEKYDLARELIDRQMRSLVQGEAAADFSGLIADTEDIYSFVRFAQWRREMAAKLRTEYADYRFTLREFTLDSSGTKATAVLDVDYSYALTGKAGGCWDCAVEFGFADTGDGPRISACQIEEEIFTDYFARLDRILAEGCGLEEAHDKLLAELGVQPDERTGEEPENRGEAGIFVACFALLLVLSALTLLLWKKVRPLRKSPE